VSRNVRLILIGVALIAIIALAWFFLLSPIRADIASTSLQIEDAQSTLASAQAKLAQAEVTRAEGKKNQARLIELSKMVPPDSEIGSLLVQIQDLASQSGIAFMSITPGAALDSTGFRMIPLAVQFAGTFFDLSDFIYRAEQMVAGPGRLLAIKQLNLQLAEAGGGAASEGTSVSPILTVTMTIYAFDTAPSAKASAATVTPATTPTDSSTSTTVPNAS
jgi:Tfp pilus assembly protein PilO